MLLQTFSATKEYDQAMELQTRPVGGRYTAVKLRPGKPCGGFCQGTCCDSVSAVPSAHSCL